MQVSSLNEVKIYSLSCGKSLPEVSALGVLRAGRPPLSWALAPACVPWTLIGSEVWVFYVVYVMVKLLSEHVQGEGTLCRSSFTFSDAL